MSVLGDTLNLITSKAYTTKVSQHFYHLVVLSCCKFPPNLKKKSPIHIFICTTFSIFILFICTLFHLEGFKLWCFCFDRSISTFSPAAPPPHIKQKANSASPEVLPHEHPFLPLETSPSQRNPLFQTSTLTQVYSQLTMT